MKRATKEVLIQFRATKEFKKRLDGAARRLELDVSAYVRMVVARSLEKVRK
jgi:hypothetical protein